MDSDSVFLWSVCGRVSLVSMQCLFWKRSPCGVLMLPLALHTWILRSGNETCKYDVLIFLASWCSSVLACLSLSDSFLSLLFVGFNYNFHSLPGHYMCLTEIWCRTGSCFCCCDQHRLTYAKLTSMMDTDCSHRTLMVLQQDIARLTLTALRNDKTERKALTFAGPRAWTTQEVGNGVILRREWLYLQVHYLPEIMTESSGQLLSSPKHSCS